MKNIKSISTFILLLLLLLQCQAKSKPISESGYFEEIKELIKSSNHGNANISFVAAAAISTPCVVHIKTKINVVVNTVSPFQDFFGNEFFFQQPRNQKQESSGSGVIIDPNGYIVTNNHVIQNATEIEVTLRNKITYKARVIGTDKDSDIALIKIEETRLPTLEFANSDSTMVGE
ncbi:MAG: trypsin-like peptidase domain-containing protein, partial [Chitinophagales bacterium]